MQDAAHVVFHTPRVGGLCIRALVNRPISIESCFASLRCLRRGCMRRIPMCLSLHTGSGECKPTRRVSAMFLLCTESNKAWHCIGRGSLCTVLRRLMCL